MEERFNEIPLPPKKENKRKPFGTDSRFKPQQVLRPSPASYTIPTVFETEKYKKKGKSISVFKEKPFLNEVPGPGQYKDTEGLGGPLFSIGMKFTPQKKNNFPGPNHYDQQIKQCLTKYKNFGNTIIQ
ncbi:unnamed protein product (macronuclear) [Paramecium tetraurelia]|uniref:Uncharacterized protein n=1 Tax=Paramecium tetraurelia TaxID=5888 RepID=A0BGA4_PARTE|nr:uncharacterized protein GSPATT00028606001 [Paramecium tetraurelia]CAK57571.1 unnamed protein product [Paramecium tetraurelia]|eukprot:XP_001424969.1 hypothetical protein (macronuclear) [Paramecium tetraurelia strain d4-2]